MPRPKLAFLSVGAALLFLLCTSAAARAAVEFCPATASVPFPVGVAFGTTATRYAYELNALTPRSVNATLIADTDKGWYRWSVSGMILKMARRFVRPAPGGPSVVPPQFYTIAASPALAVDFPVALTIRHAWVTSAGKGDDSKSGDVPAFDAVRDVDSRTNADVSPTPSAQYAAAVASSAAPPFEIGYCALQFANSTVLSPSRPPYDSSWGAGGPYGYAATIATALDPYGGLIDAWVYASSGNAAFDKVALRAAHESKFAGAVSYCRPVKSEYLYMLTVTPAL